MCSGTLLSRQTRGFGLAGVLLVSVVLTVLLASLLGANSSTLAVLRHSEGILTARTAAESLLARATYEVRTRESFGSAGETLKFQAEDADDSGNAVLTFDASQAAGLGVPPSVNNLANPESRRAANGEIIPARTARIYALGSYRNETRIVVLDLHIPPYPYAVATAGTFASSGDLTLSGMSPDTGDEVPGHLVANSDSATSVMLGPRSEISGDVVSAGGINLNGDDILVKGEVKAFEAPTTIPKIPLDSFDPRLMTSGGEPTTMDTSLYSDATLEGKVMRNGNLMLSGDTTLDGALLFVDGDLEVSGTLGGRGAIVVTGKATINGTQNLAADNEMALLVGGALNLQGRGVDSSRLEGLIYCEGDVTVRDSTVQGTLISQANGSTIPKVIMERVDLIEDSSQGAVSVEVDSSKPSFYMVFKNDGKYDHKASGDTPVIKGKKAKDLAFVGVAAKPGGGFLLYPPGGGPAWTAADSDELIALVIEQLDAFWGKKGPKKLEDRKIDKKLLADISALKPADGATSTTDDDSKLALDIDPMRFLKYGERVKVRSIRVLQNSSETVADE